MSAGAREGAWYAWDDDGQLVEEVAGLYRAGRKTAPLGAEDREKAAAALADPSPQPVESEEVAPLTLFDESGEPRDGAGG